MNVSDDDAKKYIKIFTMLGKEEIENAITEHEAAPHMRGLQKLLAKEITIMVHGESEYNKSVNATEILFGNASAANLKELDEDTFLAVFEGVPQFEVKRGELPCNIIDLLAVHSAVFSSKGECRKFIQGGGLLVNKEKSADIERIAGTDDLINGKYILVQKGKKNYYILKFV